MYYLFEVFKGEKKALIIDHQFNVTILNNVGLRRLIHYFQIARKLLLLGTVEQSVIM